MKKLLLFALIIFFFLFEFTSPSNAACTVASGAQCDACDSSGHQLCPGTETDPNDPNWGGQCSADRTCNPTQFSCNCGNAQPCQAGSTCSGVISASCNYCVTPQRTCNSDPVVYGGEYNQCSAPDNTCNSNNGTQRSLYTKYNGEDGCELSSGPDQPCTANNCTGGNTCVNGSCIGGAPIPTPTPGGSQSCLTLHGPGDIGCGLCHYYEQTGGTCTDYQDQCCYGAPGGVVSGTPTPGITPPSNPCAGEVPSFSCAQYGVQDLSTGVTATGKAKNSVVNGNYGTSVLTINPGDKIKVDGYFNLNAAGLWLWNWFNIKNTSGVLLSRCVEAGTYKDSAGYNYCLGGIGQIISDQKDGNGYYKRPAGWDMTDEGVLVSPHKTYDEYLWSNDFGDFREYRGTCTSSGDISCCARRDNPDMSVDINGHRTKECYNPTEGDPCEIFIKPEACKYDDGDGNPKTPYVLSRDKQYIRSFSTPGDYIVEGTQRYQCGQNEDNPCQVKVTVRNPGPPTGSITANPSPCVMTEGNTTCTTTITSNVQNGTEMKVIIDGVEFVPPTAITYNHTSSSDAPWITAITYAFELWAKNAYFPDYAKISTAYVNGYPYIHGDVYIDLNENGFKENGEPAYTGGGVVTVGGTPINLDANGHFVRTNMAPGNTYTVSLSVPSGYYLWTPNDISVGLTIPTTVNFGIAPLHSVSGRIFNDINKNKIFDGTDTLYPTGLRMHVDGNGISNDFFSTAPGVFSFGNLPSGTYDVSLSGAPAGYAMIWPRSGPPPTYTITVGNRPCSPGVLGLAIGAACSSAFNVTELNFAISNAIPWTQIIGLDARFDNGFTNPVPSIDPSVCSAGYTMIPGSSTTPGVITIGGSTPSLSFGARSAPSTTGWVVGSPFSEYFTPLSSTPDSNNTFQASGIRTAYDYVMANAKQSNIAPATDNMKLITGCSNLSSCSLSSATNGIFQANSDVTLTNTSFANAKDFVFFINGNLTINGTIITPVGSTATFIVKGNIIVNPTVGTNIDTCPPVAGQIQGFFSTDKSFTIESNDPTQQGLNCSDLTGPDLILNIDGVIVTNASLSGGGFTNKRDLCGKNVTNPSVSVKERLDFILNAPEILKQKSYIYREIAP